ncbi:N-acetyltransferase [Marmoricola endophyticus]|uniref:N-acetyltransferase n=1 Tax=Marmoricola endophyticus TaxID=2040280 RepID=A0A917BIJ4_9ACTN|nr:GNAT family protein [Marmoricola endophyticus]GGF46994.1 N-acetyltransferase [Marmoricola endophyticus]
MADLIDAESAFAYGETILTGDRVRLRGLREADVPVLAQWEMDPGRMVTSANQVRPPSEGAARQQVAGWCANDRDDSIGFAVETAGEPSVLIGCLGLSGIRPKDRVATLAISLGREHLGQGYGTDAIRVLVGYAFREMALHRIQLDVWPFNQQAIRAYESIGFVEEGRRRSAVWHDGQWYDQVLMGILESEWAGGRGTTEAAGD